MSSFLEGSDQNLFNFYWLDKGDKKTKKFIMFIKNSKMNIIFGDEKIITKEEPSYTQTLFINILLRYLKLLCIKYSREKR
jgi:hypothetical protein